MNGPVRRLALSLFVAFGLLVAASGFQHVIAGPEYRDDPRNTRVATGRTGRERGPVVTADGVAVARSVADPDDPRIFRREYPEGALYAHVVGYSTLLFGTTGLERARASELVSNRDATISGVINAILGGDVRPRGIQLTIRDDLQRVAAAALGDQRGAVVALDSTTGAVLALVSSPSYDPNTLLGSEAGPAGAALDEDRAEPLRNRAIGATYAPGSTFKIVTTAAALDSGIAGPTTEFDDPVALELPGSTAVIRNFDRGRCGSGGTVTLAEGFAQSCNTTFAALGMQVGAGFLVGAAEDFGFNQEVPFDLTVEPSVIPGVSDFGSDLPAVAQSAIGQRDVRATPLELAMAGAAVASGGQIMQPYLVDEVFTADAETDSVTEPVVWRRAMSPAAAATIADLMERAVTSGTAGRAAVPGVRIAGKTGTAEVPGGPPHAWFVGFGPVAAEPGTPQIVVAVVVESGGDVGEDATGGTVAAPIAQQVLAKFFE
ncbi:MAG TPA: penicillin-binding protein 2 [Acidimicrobiia bacterium]